MESERWSRIREILEAAFEQEAARRIPWVEEACGGDDVLRREVLELLAMDESTGSKPGLLDQSPTDRIRSGGNRMDQPAVGERIGNYRILGELGAGGMGIVFEAEQDNPPRPVALKVLRPGLVGPRALRRFEHESRALGRLRHPGIAQVLEAGTFGTGANAQPFIAMELVGGSSLTDHAREHRLSRESRLRLFCDVCRAVHHAHEKGVIHRDLKPGNILVEQSGQPKILDFGIARLQDDDGVETLHTRAGQLVGTLAYMSPEQVSGDPDLVDTRSDVHALGVLLYELLTGSLPYEVAGKSTAEGVRLVAEADPVPLSARDASLRGDLSTIVHTCLAKEPDRRYSSAAEVEQEVERYLDNRPLQARPPSVVYQLTKFARRHRTLVGGVVAVCLVLAVSFVIILDLWRKAEDAAEIAGKKQKQAEIEAEQADAAREFMQEVLIQASPRQRAGGKVTLDDVLDTAAAKIDHVQEPLVEASVRHTLGRVYNDLGEMDKAENNLSRALALYEEAYGPRHLKIAYVLTNLAQLRQRQGRFEEAQELAERVIEWQPQQVLVIGTAYLNAGNAAYSRGKIDEAERYYRAAVDVYQGKGVDTEQDLATSQAALAMVLNRRGRKADAEKLYRASLEARGRGLGKRNAASLVTMGNLASLLESQSRLEEAQALRRDALSIAQEAYGPEHAEVGVCERALGRLLCLRGNTDQGIPLMRSGIRTQEKALGSTHPRVAQSLNLLGAVLLEQKQPDEALRLRERATKIAREAFGPNHPLSIQIELGIGETLLALKRDQEAERRLCVCVKRAVKEIPWAKGTVVSARRAWARALLRLKREAEAKPVLERLAVDAKGSKTGKWAASQLQRILNSPPEDRR